MEIKTTSKKRIYFLKVPVDIINEEDFFNLIKKNIEKEQNNLQIMFLTMNALFKARRDSLYYKCLYDANLILPTARGIVRGIHFLRKIKATRFNPFDFIISLLSFAEKNKYPVYLLGGKKEDLEKAEKNVRTSFPELKIIGRHTGYINGETEKNVITVIRKSSPIFLLVGRGVKDKEMWLYRHRQELGAKITVWIDDCIEIFAGTHQYVPGKVFAAGLEAVHGLTKRPWRIFLFFRYLFFNWLLLIYKIFKL